MRWPAPAIAIMAAALLAGCGFHLRSWALEGTFHVEALRAPALARALEAALGDAGAALANTADAADVVVRLADEREGRRGVALTPGGRVAEYEVALTVSFVAEEAAGGQIVPRRALRAERVYRLDETNLVGSREEEGLIRRELRQDLAQRIVRQLVAATGAR